MASDGDIIDTMFSGIISLIGWVITGILKLFWAILSGTFGVIIGLFKSNPAE